VGSIWAVAEINKSGAHGYGSSDKNCGQPVRTAAAIAAGLAVLAAALVALHVPQERGPDDVGQRLAALVGYSPRASPEVVGDAEPPDGRLRRVRHAG
jgi:hypothetical protein